MERWVRGAPTDGASGRGLPGTPQEVDSGAGSASSAGSCIPPTVWSELPSSGAGAPAPADVQPGPPGQSAYGQGEQAGYWADTDGGRPITGAAKKKRRTVAAGRKPEEKEEGKE
jgi:hypothetical protein